MSLLKINLLAIITLLMSGCATTQQTEGTYDPWEGYNRAMYSFNSAFDRALLKPVAKGYDAILPDPISQAITNVFRNLNEVTVIFNDLLQFKFSQAADDTGRFLLNSTVGVAGVFDVASLAGHKKNDEDFGQTLGAWGFGPGPYFVIPLLGPRNIRDGVFGLAVNVWTEPVSYITHVPTRNQLYGLWYVDTRANLLRASNVIDEAVIDEYSYVRDAYMQRRQYLVYDGNPPEEEFDVFEEN